MHSDLLKLFNYFTILDSEEEELFRQLFKPAVLKKNEFFLKSGDFNNKIAFIKKGLVRYFVLKEGEEATLEFTKEGEFIAEYQSFINRQESTQTIQAIEDCELLTVSYDGLQQIYNSTKSGNLLGRMVVEHRFNVMINQLLSIYRHSPEERYTYFLENYSDISQRIPQYLIASYVGIKPQSLSRIRKRISHGIS
jgi:CRP-like cAMP-binding protein